MFEELHPRIIKSQISQDKNEKLKGLINERIKLSLEQKKRNTH